MAIPGQDNFQNLVESHPRAMMLATPEPRIIYVNRMFERITGFRRDEVVGEKPSVLSSGFHGPEFYREMWSRIGVKGQWEGVVWNRRKNGETYPQWLMVHQMQGSDGAMYAGMFMDIGDLTSFEERLASMAYYDALTELPNRALFLELLELCIARRRDCGGPFALLFIDMDYFKDINDIHGHAIGDLLLQQAALCIRSVLREGDVVARLSGDEFAAMVELDPDASDEQLNQLSVRLINAFRSPLLVNGVEHFISVSVGASRFPADGGTGSELLQRADKAMYQAKQSGRARFQLYSDALVTVKEEDQRLARALVVSLKTAPAEFSVVYQPQYNLKTGQADGMEVLIR
ncbi:diguanylate cyclase [uncultured Marinobacter sp.]|uniref:diguanylate cyclase domain-containing protein n=1 Tax=uncultured Marinobacter sp. TaxID=187379 RepID=UPI0030D974DE